jgi:glycosyltransferase involved in cell wall biosynthesis
MGTDHVRSFDCREIGPKLCKLIQRSVDREITAIEGPLVSICIPTFNRKEYLEVTLESIVNQTYKNIEIVVVDDGSTDGTEEMIKDFNFPIRYHWQENAGDAAARNKLISLAKGEYISFIDSDDLLMPDSVERMVGAVITEPVDTIVYGSYYRIDAEGKVYGKCKRKLYSGKISRYLFEDIIVHSCGSLFPKRILNGQNTFDTRLKVCSDYAVWLELSLKVPFKALVGPTFKRRRHKNNLSSPSFKNCLTEFNVLKNFYDHRGGSKVVPAKSANKVFAKEASRAGRAAIREGLYCQGY